MFKMHLELEFCAFKFFISACKFTFPTESPSKGERAVNTGSLHIRPPGFCLQRTPRRALPASVPSPLTSRGPSPADSESSRGCRQRPAHSPGHCGGSAGARGLCDPAGDRPPLSGLRECGRHSRARPSRAPRNRHRTFWKRRPAGAPGTPGPRRRQRPWRTRRRGLTRGGASAGRPRAIRPRRAGPASPALWLRLHPPPPWRRPGSFILRRARWTPALCSLQPELPPPLPPPPPPPACRAPSPRRRPPSKSAGETAARSAAATHRGPRPPPATSPPLVPPPSHSTTLGGQWSPRGLPHRRPGSPACPRHGCAW